MITIPTISQLYNQILNDLETSFESSIPLGVKIALRAYAGVQAGKLKLFYIALGGVQKNVFPDTADSESSGGTLERFGRIKLRRNPSPAQAGQYILVVTGQLGGAIDAQTTWKSNDDSISPGMLFILDTAYVMPGVAGSITVRALTAGSSSRLEAGDQLTATQPIANVNSLATVDTEFIPPINAESIEDYRRKTIDAYQLEPQGGAPGDYRLWSKDQAGVKEVYPYAKTGAANEGNVYVEANPEDSTDGFGTPSAAILEGVEDVIELDPDTSKNINDRGRRPMTVFQIHVLPVTIRQIDIQISDFEDITPDIQTIIFNALKEALSTVRPFIAGADILSEKNDIFNINKIISIILTVAPGAAFDAVTMDVDGVPTSTITFINGDIPHLDTVTYP